MTSTMLAARAYAGETVLRLEEVPQPTAEPGDVVIKVKSAGITNGLIGLWHRGMFPVLPRTLGHEAAGYVSAIGPGVSGLEVGDRVRLHPNLTCRQCENCLNDREQFCDQSSMIGHGIFGANAMPLYARYLDGALAEYVRAPAWAVEPLPDLISFEVGAKLHDVADGLRAFRAAAPPPGATVVVTAATGVLGSAMVRLAPFFGVSRLIAVGRSGKRLARLQQLAPDLVEVLSLEDLGDDWGETQGLTRAIRAHVPRGPDVVFDFFDSGPGTWQAIASMKTGGTATLMAPNLSPPPVPTVAFITGGWRVLGTRSCTRSDGQTISDWIECGMLRIDDLITHRFALADVVTAATVVSERPDPTGMVVVNPGQVPGDDERAVTSAQGVSVS